jgi:hypothetical protein
MALLRFVLNAFLTVMLLEVVIGIAKRAKAVLAVRGVGRLDPPGSA